MNKELNGFIEESEIYNRLREKIIENERESILNRYYSEGEFEQDLVKFLRKVELDLVCYGGKIQVERCTYEQSRVKVDCMETKLEKHMELVEEWDLEYLKDIEMAFSSMMSRLSEWLPIVKSNIKRCEK